MDSYSGKLKVFFSIYASENGGRVQKLTASHHVDFHEGVSGDIYPTGMVLELLASQVWPFSDAPAERVCNVF